MISAAINPRDRGAGFASGGGTNPTGTGRLGRRRLNAVFAGPIGQMLLVAEPS